MNLFLKIKGSPRIKEIVIRVNPDSIPFLIYLTLSIKYGSNKLLASLLFRSKSSCLKFDLTI